MNNNIDKALIIRAKKTANTFLITGNDLVKQSAELIIAKKEDVQIATSIMKDCQLTEKELEAKRLEITKPLNDFITEVNVLFRETATPILQAKSDIKQKILVWNQEQERIKLEEERKRFEAEQARLRKLEEERLLREKIELEKRLAEEAKLKAEQERLRKLEEERLRKEFEANKASEEEQARLKAIADKQRLEREKIEQEKLEIIRKNREIEEEKLRIAEEKKEMTRKWIADQKALIEGKDRKVKGIVNLWTYEIIDEALLPRVFCSPDSKKINEAIKQGIREIEGLRIYENKIVR
ncbi:MAG: hypothetical protein U1E54_04730 [Candidatus Levybacteria bacterium]|nr:hypothetical protein [Candidatus Levybacteria bacterium]